MAQITVGYPHNPDDTEEYKKFMSSLIEVGDTPIVVMDMENKGLSYGQWSRIFDHYRDEFSHYIFIEDDYVPVLDNFDQELHDMFEEEDCGFLCGLYANDGDNFGHGVCRTPHSAISNGISSCQILDKVHGTNGFFLQNAKDSQQQVGFSKGFTDAGYAIKDWLHKYRCLYWPHKEIFRMYWDNSMKDIIVPLQFLEEGKDWGFDKFRRRSGVMRKFREREGSVKKEVPPQVRKQINAGKSQREALAQRLARQRRGLKP